MKTLLNRAPLSPSFQKLRNQLPDLIGTLQADPNWYVSIYTEKKSANSFSVNLKQTQISDQHIEGIVLRIYDGYTLFEQATDKLEFNEIEKEAKALVLRVKKNKYPDTLTKRNYPAPSWKDRLKQKLDPEIISQIESTSPLNSLTSKTPIHFGIRFERDPVNLSTDDRLTRLKQTLEKFKQLSPKVGLTESDLSFIVARESISVEESLFIDKEVNLSQTLYRVALTLIVMSKENRSVERFGGLGGHELIEVKDEKILHLLEDLSHLKKAEHLIPGSYDLILSPTLSGVLAHEAFGHSQEGDTCARGRSKAWDLHLSGEKVGNEHATILNNPAAFHNANEPGAAWGSYFFDEEGWIAEEQIILDKGKLNPPMTNLTSAIRLNVPRSANGKRENFQHGVYTRQTNTYFSPGKATLNELLQKMQNGFLALNAAGGMEDPKGMGIQVGIQFLKEVKYGKLTGKVFKGPAGGDIQLTGYVPTVLNSIVDKSKIEAESDKPDTATHPFNDCGGCGKYHKESVMAGCGGTYLYLKNITLG